MLKKVIFLSIVVCNILLVYNYIQVKNKNIIHERKNYSGNLSLSNINQTNFIDSLRIKKWGSLKSTSIIFDTTLVLFFFSKSNCQNCLEFLIDYFTFSRGYRFNYYLISTDINEERDKLPFIIKFRQQRNFYSLDKLQFSSQFNERLPLLLVVNKNRKVLYHKTIEPFDYLSKNSIINEQFDFLFKK